MDLRFLDQAEGNDVGEVSGIRFFLTDPVAFVRESGLLLTILFILAGGLALNLTPCVLPMIPINLAIIGAGAQAGSKGRGFALGATYGLGIALVYGLLGVAVVLTGSQFGTIQANPWFNLVIAIIFVVLALAMFDVFHIDLSRFQSKLGGGQQKQGSFLVAITMGSVAALLAGACVAPVVIAVLLLATNVYEASGPVGLTLPFVLGIGMALPWPFAGAGLSFLPKPGKWMEYIKYGFGVGIVFFALYYGHLSYRAFRPADITEHGEVEGHLLVDGTSNVGLADALKQARADETPVFIDFWASWCKNCQVMDKTTFKDEMVKARLEGYTFIKYIAEDPVNPNTKTVMDHFEVQARRFGLEIMSGRVDGINVGEEYKEVLIGGFPFKAKVVVVATGLIQRLGVPGEHRHRSCPLAAPETRTQGRRQVDGRYPVLGTRHDSGGGHRHRHHRVGIAKSRLHAVPRAGIRLRRRLGGGACGVSVRPVHRRARLVRACLPGRRFLQPARQRQPRTRQRGGAQQV